MSRPSPGRTLSVVIVTYNAVDELRQCLDSIWTETDEEELPLDLIVVDDGGNTDSRKVVEDQQRGWQWLYLSPPSENFRPAAARNLGLRHARGDRVLCLDGDCLARPDMLKQHRLVFDNEVRCGLRTHLSRDNKPVRRDERFHLRGGPYALSHAGLASKTRKPFEISYRAAWSFQMSFPRELALSIGGFNEEFQEYGGEDQEFAGRMRQAGCRLVLDPLALCYHIDHPKRKGDWAQRVQQSLQNPSPIRNGGPLYAAVPL